MEFNNEKINYLGKVLAFTGALLGIIHIIPNGGILQIALVGIGGVMVFLTEKN